ncbi:hypothetical protein D3C78_1511700 [compost metagenome]
MAHDTATFQLHLTHQRTHRLRQRQVVELARTQPPQQTPHRIVHPKRELLDMCPTLDHAAVFRCQALNNPRLSANGCDRLADIVVQFTCHFLPHALFSFDQPFCQTAVTRQLVL